MKPASLVNHPIVEDALVRLRESSTPPELFRNALAQASAVLAMEALRNTRTRVVTVQTPLAKTRGRIFRDRLVLVVVLRAGLGMLEGVMTLTPHAEAAFVGVRRDEKTLQPHFSYSQIPADLRQADVLILDPMLATGGSLASVVEEVLRSRPRSISSLHVVGAPEGVKKINRLFPEVQIYLGALDPRLNNRGYILPGLGDAGDRQFGPGSPG